MLHEVDIKAAVDAANAGKKVLVMVVLKGEYDVTSLQTYLEDARFLVDEPEGKQPTPKPAPEQLQTNDDTWKEPVEYETIHELKADKPKNTRQRIREALPEIRKMLESGMSQRAIAEQLGFNQAEISRALKEDRGAKDDKATV